MEIAMIIEMVVAIAATVVFCRMWELHSDPKEVEKTDRDGKSVLMQNTMMVSGVVAVTFWVIVVTFLLKL